MTRTTSVAAPMMLFAMRRLIILLTIFFLIGCIDNKKNAPTSSDKLIAVSDKSLKEEYLESKAVPQIDTTSCDETALAFLELVDKNIQADFFHLLDSIRKAQYPQNDQDTTISVDLTPKLLDKFLNDLNKAQFAQTGKFEKEYNFNIAPPEFADSKACTDQISLSFEKNTCSFRLVITNRFFAEWCHGSSVVYGFKINGGKISSFGRNEAG